jgi:amino acid adenylation domain-containing protein
MTVRINSTEESSRDGERIIGLTDAQRGFWAQTALGPDAARAYNVSYTVELRGSYDHAAMQRAFQAVVQRHEALRTRLGADSNSQVVAPWAEIEVPLVDVSHLGALEREAQGHQFLEASAAQPFDPAVAPLLRALGVRLEPKRHLLTLTAHHALANGPSCLVLLGDLCALYRGQADLGTPMQLSEFVRRQPALGRADDQAFWLRQFDGPLSRLQLPLDRPRPRVRSFKGGHATFALDAKTCQALRGVAATQDSSLYALLLGAFTVLMGRLSDQEDVVVGATFESGIRQLQGGAGLVAHTTNVLPMRSRIAFDIPFGEFLKHTQQLVLAVSDHKEYFFGRLIERLRIPHDPALPDLFSVLFNFFGAEFHQIVGDLEVELLKGQYPYSAPRDASMFDLDFDVTKKSGGLEFRCAYAAALFEPETIQRWLSYYQNLLAGILANPHARVSELPLLDEAGRRRLLMECNATMRDYPGAVCLHQLFEAQVERSPQAVALEYEGQSLSYTELNGRANRLAHRLRKLGVGPEATVGMMAERSIETIIGLLAVLKAGGAYLPLDPAQPTQRLARVLDDAQAAVVLMQRHLAEKLSPERREKVGILEENLQNESEANPLNHNRPEHAAYIIYTSGSTGVPKGVVNTHRGICNRLCWWRDYLGLSAGDRILHRSPLFFDVSLSEIFGALSSGAVLVIARPGLHGDTRYLIETICAYRVTAIDFVPALLAVFLDNAGAARCSSLRHVTVGGEALSAELNHRFFTVLPQAALHNLYGPTEAAVDVSHWNCRRSLHAANVPIGRPHANTQLYILDRALQPVPIGVAGELYIGGAQVARGYLNRPELTAEKFMPNPFGPGRLYKTGDLCRYRSDGAIEFLGRLDDQVKVRGFRIELGEIEAVLKQHLTVRDCVALVRAVNGSADPRIVAYVTGEHIRHDDLRSHAKRLLPNYMVPSAFVTLERLPLSPNGKVDRRALPDPEPGCKAKAQVRPRDLVDAELLNIWRDELRQPELGVTDDFFEVGGDSLLALKIFVRIEEEFQCRLPLSTLFTAPTVTLLAQILKNALSLPSSYVLVPIRPAGLRPPFFGVHGGDGNVLFYRKLAHLLGNDQPFYALQAPALNGRPMEPLSIEMMAERYLSEIRQVHPCGLYLLGGYSFGGLVAYELAQRLRLAGENVALLVMFDTFNPARLRLQPFGVRLRRALRGRSDLSFNQMSQFVARRMPSPAGELVLRWNATLYRRLKWVLRQDRHVIDPALWRVITAHERAFMNYQPLPYTGKVHLFRVPDEGENYKTTVDGGWGDIVRGGLEIHHLPGTHLQLFSDQNVPRVAKVLRECIEGALLQHHRKNAYQCKVNTF